MLLPLLAPLLAVLITAALNPRPSLALRLLTWTTPSLPIGAWIAALAGGGAALSAGATALALRGGEPVLRRKVQRSAQEPWEEASPADSTWRRDRPEPQQRRWRPGAPGVATEPDRRAGLWDQAGAGAGPSRAPGQPPPTVAVPYRVIRSPSARAEPAVARAAGADARPAEPQPVPAWGDDWSDDSQEDW